jgi:hypothetical protein
MVPMPSNPLPLEQCWKPQALGHILLWDDIVSVLRLSDDEFGNLFHELALGCATHHFQEGGVRGAGSNVLATRYL